MGQISRQIANVVVAALIAATIGYFIHEEMGLSARTIRRDALQGAAFFGVALISDALLRGRNRQ